MARVATAAGADRTVAGASKAAEPDGRQDVAIRTARAKHVAFPTFKLKLDRSIDGEYPGIPVSWEFQVALEGELKVQQQGFLKPLTISKDQIELEGSTASRSREPSATASCCAAATLLGVSIKSTVEPPRPTGEL